MGRRGRSIVRVGVEVVRSRGERALRRPKSVLGRTKVRMLL